MCICFFDSSKRAEAALTSPYVATYLDSMYDIMKSGLINPGYGGRDFAYNNPDVSERLKNLIEESIGWRMNVEIVRLEGRVPTRKIFNGVYVLDSLQKYSKPNGRGCGAWFDYTVNNVGHVFRSALNFITGGFFSSSLNSEWTETEEAIATKFTIAVIEAVRRNGNQHYAMNEQELRVEARCCARKILAECLEEYAHSLQQAQEDYVTLDDSPEALSKNSEKAFVTNMLAYFKRPGEA